MLRSPQITVEFVDAGRLEASLKRVLASVKSRIVPRPQDRARMSRLEGKLRVTLDEILRASGVEADVSVQGSYARDTWLRQEADLDIFARFADSVDRKDWTEMFLPAIRRGFKQYEQTERFAEHPYLELWADGVRVNIVPCYKVEKGKWKSATDRTPYHTEYMRANLTGALKDEARLLKRFTKGVGVYGAEIRVGGFSGMLVDTLLLEYPSFVETLKAASSWSERVLIDVEGRRRAGSDSDPRFKSGFVVVDPVDPKRNLAAAVRDERLWGFVAAARAFLRTPQLSYFFPSKPRVPGRNGFSKRLSSSGYDFAVVAFSHSRVISDILWGQLFRLERALVSLLERQGFRVLRSQAWSDDNASGAVFLELERAVLAKAQLHFGPPVFKQEESRRFLDRHLNAGDTVTGPWLTSGRWVVLKTRRLRSVGALLKAGLREGNLGLVIPEQLRRGFASTAKIVLNEEILRLLTSPGFGTAFWQFLDGRPEWLKKPRS